MVHIQIKSGVTFRKILYSWPVIIIFTVILGALAIKAFGSWQDYRTISKEYGKLQKEIAEVEKNRKEAEENLALLKDDFGRDRVIREQFDLQKKDEKVIIILDEDKQRTENEQLTAGLSVLSTIKNFLADIFSRD